jgi:hypothetical protein
MTSHLEKWNNRWQDYVKRQRLFLLLELPTPVVDFFSKSSILSCSLYYENRSVPCNVYEIILMKQSTSYTFWKFEYLRPDSHTFSTWFYCENIPHEPTYIKQQKMGQFFSVSPLEGKKIEILFDSFPFLEMIRCEQKKNNA